MQVQLVRDDSSPWSDWIDDLAIVRPARPGVARLSGVEIRDILYFGTAPGSQAPRMCGPSRRGQEMGRQ